MQTKTWGNYLAKRMTFPMDSRNLHHLFCPDYEGSKNATSRDNRKSVAALQRIDNSLRMSIMSELDQNDNNPRLSILSMQSELEQSLYDDDDMDGPRRLDGISESGDTRVDNDRASVFGDPDDDIETMSRAFSVTSLEDLDTEELIDDNTNSGGLPKFLDESENDDSQFIPQDPQTYYNDQGSQASQSNYGDQEMHDYHSSAGSIPRSLYGDESAPAQSFVDEECYEETHNTNEISDKRSLVEEYYDTGEAAPFFSDTNSIT